MNRKKVFIALGIVGILLSLCVAGFLYLSARAERSESGVARLFLTNLLQGKEDSAESYLSSDLRNLVEIECPDGSVIRCIEDSISPEWGQFEETLFGVGSGSRNTVLYYTYWTGLEAQAVTVVIMMGMENDKWVVIGWRGFVMSQGADFDIGFLRGTRHDNEFPPYVE